VLSQEDAPQAEPPQQAQHVEVGADEFASVVAGSRMQL
jgi:hypothetical protein